MSSNIYFHMNESGDFLADSQSFEEGKDIFITLSDGKGTDLTVFLTRTQAAQLVNKLDGCVAKWDKSNGLEVV